MEAEVMEVAEVSCKPHSTVRGLRLVVWVTDPPGDSHGKRLAS
jgi:hypothetical protein